MNDFEIDLTEALRDTEDEMRVGESYESTDRKEFWTKTAINYSHQLNRAEYLLWRLRGYDEPGFDMKGLVFSIVHKEMEDLFSTMERNLAHIKEYCGQELAGKVESEIFYLESELAIYYEFTLQYRS